MIRSLRMRDDQAACLVIATLVAACTQTAAERAPDAAVDGGDRIDAITIDAITIDASEPDAGSGSAIALGAWIPGAPQDATRIDAFTTLVGTAPTVVHWYQSWAQWSAFSRSSLDAVVAHHATPMITWEPWDPAAGVAQPSYALAAIARGDHDAYLHTWAQAAAAWGGIFFLRFAHEMNGNWYPWSIGVNGNTAADYVAAWQHVRAIFVAEGATNVRWVWCPNVEYTGSAPLADAYPGDALVDWVALDGYNFGTSQPTTQWRSVLGVFAASYGTLAALSARPMMIAETASAEQGGDKAAWIRSLVSDVPTSLPRVRVLLWFDEHKEADWRVDSSTTSLAAFSELAASATFAGRAMP